jgi:isopentenyl-diphosphate Delta-isomerase
MKEIIDNVDENDKVIGKDTRESIKKRKLNYRICHIWLLNQKGELMICKRPINNKAYAGLWTSTAGGHVKTGESYHKAALREAEEELGVKLNLNHKFKYHYLHPRGCHVFIDLWFANYNQKLTLDKNEIIESRFISFTNLQQEIIEFPEIFNPQLKKMVKKWLFLQKEK